jgi:2-polyprenyl-3-methyl-5-hydroxy-6-metoxy-1,4-benzoquinol methylase
MEESHNCNLCGHSSLKRIPFRYSFSGRYLQGMKCCSCGLISILPHPSDSELTEMYSDTYFTVADEKTHHGKTDYITDIEKINYSEQISFIKSIVKGGNLLEVGCATGTFLNQIKTHGFQVTGIELSSFAANYGREKYGINIINKPFDKNLPDQDLKKDTFDAILMGDVLEHFTDPSDAVRVALSLLKKGGKLIAHVPGTLNLISTRMAFAFYHLTGKQKTMTIPPYHLTEFFPGTLRKMFLMNGFSEAKILQRTKHPNTIPLRHSRTENFIKLSTQYPNYYLTKFFGIYGDRITGIATK